MSRSVLPIVTDLDRRYFGDRAASDGVDQLGYLEGTLSRFGKSYIGEPDAIAAELSRDAAVREADTLLLTVPNQLGVEYNAHLLETFAAHIAACNPLSSGAAGGGSGRPVPARLVCFAGIGDLLARRRSCSRTISNARGGERAAGRRTSSCRGSRAGRPRSRTALRS